MKIAVIAPDMWTGNRNVFADSGVTVTCIDNDKEDKKAKNGVIPIYEPGLGMIKSNFGKKDFLFRHS